MRNEAEARFEELIAREKADAERVARAALVTLGWKVHYCEATRVRVRPPYWTVALEAQAEDQISSWGASVHFDGSVAGEAFITELTELLGGSKETDKWGGIFDGVDASSHGDGIDVEVVDGNRLDLRSSEPWITFFPESTNSAHVTVSDSPRTQTP